MTEPRSGADAPGGKEDVDRDADAVRIETVAGGEATLIAAGSVRELREALERGELDFTPLAKPRS